MANGGEATGSTGMRLAPDHMQWLWRMAVGTQREFDEHKSQHHVRDKSLESRLAKLEKRFDRTETIAPGSARRSAFVTVDAISCGDTVLPLVKPTRELRELVQECFGVTVIPRQDVREISKTAVRRFLKLEQKAANAQLTEAEFLTWGKICRVVDRDSLYRVRKSRKPTWRFGEITADDAGTRTIRWSSGSVHPHTAEAIAAVDFLEIGEWFEADVYQDVDETILRIVNVRPRPEYRIATQAETLDFFSGKP